MTKAPMNWLEQPRIAVPAGLSVSGSVRPPSSKSVSHRMMNLTLLHGKRQRITKLLAAQDLDLFQAAFAARGWTVTGTAEDLLLEPPADASDQALPARVDCGNAGTMFRFLVATCCVIDGVTIIDGTPRLRERPIAPLVSALRELGAEIEFLGEEGCAPLKIRGGDLRGGVTSIDAGESSQYLSALLMACGFLKEPTTIEVSSLVSTPYVDVTLAALERFGVRAPRAQTGVAGSSRWLVEPFEADQLTPHSAKRDSFEIEADYSAAAYPAAAAMISGGSVVIEGLDRSSPQGDRQFLDVLVAAGGVMEWLSGRDGGPASVRFSGRPERALDVDLGDMPDQVPTLAAVAAFCPGTSRIRNVAHLRIKESDRLRAVALEWSKLGITVRETEDGLEIDGRPEWLTDSIHEAPCEIATYDDHRIAMSAALVGLKRPLEVLDPGVVAKSYPGFWLDLFRLLPT